MTEMLAGINMPSMAQNMQKDIQEQKTKQTESENQTFLDNNQESGRTEAFADQAAQDRPETIAGQNNMESPGVDAQQKSGTTVEESEITSPGTDNSPALDLGGPSSLQDLNSTTSALERTRPSLHSGSLAYASQEHQNAQTEEQAVSATAADAGGSILDAMV